MLKWNDVDQNDFREINKIAGLDVLTSLVKNLKFTQILAICSSVNYFPKW